MSDSALAYNHIAIDAVESAEELSKLLIAILRDDEYSDDAPNAHEAPQVLKTSTFRESLVKSIHLLNRMAGSQLNGNGFL